MDALLMIKLEEEKRKAIEHIAANIGRAEIRRKVWRDGREKYEIWLSKPEEVE